MTDQAPCRDRVTARPHYFSGQLLQTEDLREEQEYLLDRIRSHNRLHGYGTVCGLAVAPTEPPSGRVVVGPGVALDCCGREIVVKKRIELDLTAAKAGRLFVTLAYGEEEAAPIPTDDPDRIQPTRVREVPLLAATADNPDQAIRVDGSVTPCHQCDNPRLVIASIDKPRRKPITKARIDNSVRPTVSIAHHPPSPRRRRWLKRGVALAGAAASVAWARRLFRSDG
jgi:hypothetical protein